MAYGEPFGGKDWSRENQFSPSFPLLTALLPLICQSSMYFLSVYCPFSQFDIPVPISCCSFYNTVSGRASPLICCSSGCVCHFWPFLLPNILFFFINLFLFIYFWLHWVFICCARAFSSCGAWASRCGGFSCCRARALGARASVVVARGLSSCGAQA